MITKRAIAAHSPRNSRKLLTSPPTQYSNLALLEYCFLCSFLGLTWRNSSFSEFLSEFKLLVILEYGFVSPSDCRLVGLTPLTLGDGRSFHRTPVLEAETDVRCVSDSSSLSSADFRLFGGAEAEGDEDEVP